MAACAAFPTRAEGFGLPMIEALLRGMPVACSDLPVLREVGGEFPFYFDPDDPAGRRSGDRCGACHAAASARRRASGRPGSRWEAAAAGTWAVYDRVASPLMLHVGLNLVFLIPGETGGMETAARETIPHLAASDDLRLTLFVNREAAGTFGGVAEEVVVPVNATSRIQWVRGEQQHIPRLAARHGCDIVHSLGSTAPLARALQARHHDPRSQLPQGARRATSGCEGSACARSCRPPRAARTGSSWTRHPPVTTCASC